MTTTEHETKTSRLTQQHDELRKRVRGARRVLRDAEHQRDRARGVANRFDAKVNVLWWFLGLGVAGIVGGTVVVFVDSLTPLTLTGPIVACYVAGSVIGTAAAVYIGVVHYLDDTSVKTGSGSRYDDSTELMSRRAYAEYREHRAEDALDELTELSVELQEVDEELRLARDAS
jgi:hypothetical protein